MCHQIPFGCILNAGSDVSSNTVWLHIERWFLCVIKYRLVFVCHQIPFACRFNHSFLCPQTEFISIFNRGRWRLIKSPFASNQAFACAFNHSHSSAMRRCLLASSVTDYLQIDRFISNIMNQSVQAFRNPCAMILNESGNQTAWSRAYLSIAVNSPLR
jgi:hypothetical protein